MTSGRRFISSVLAAFALGCSLARTLIAAEPSYPPQASLEEIQQRVEQCDADHPRLFVSQQDLTELRELKGEDSLRGEVAALVIVAADQLESVRPIERKLEGKRLLGESRKCVQRVLTLAMAHHLTGDLRYVDRCEREMVAVARFADWNPSHFLDVAEMTFGLAIGYDWLYDQLNDTARQEIRTAIVDKGVSLPFETKHRRWVRATNNWGQVCHGGLTAGALAVMEDEPELAARTIHNALENVTASMAVYAPKGSYPEGPGYWAYGTSYNVWLIAMLNGVFGEDFGLSAAPGFAETGAYPALACGPSGLYFNYADGSASRGPEPVRFWFAAHYDHPEWLQGERELWQEVVDKDNAAAPDRLNRFLPLALLWMNEADEASAESLPLNWSGEGDVPVTIHRSSWTDPSATFVGFKAGSPSANHGQMDVGSFVLDADGVRWAVDLGAEGYHAIEERGMSLWSQAQTSDRWKIFRQSNTGHNTLVIDGQLQRAASDAPVIAFSDNPSRAYSIADLTPAYEGQAASVRRGVKLLQLGEVLIQDEISGLKPGSRVRWGMITPGELTGAIDERSDAIKLEQQGKRLTLTRLSPEATRWQEIDTATPRNEWDSPNPGTRMVAFEAVAPESGELTLAVVATPGSSETPQGAAVELQPLGEWGGDSE